MLKRTLTALLVITVLFSCISFAFAAPKLPYAIKVNRAHNTITVYALDENGEYTVPHKAILCSTARKGFVTPLGNYKLETYRTLWRYMLDGSYAQYVVAWNGNYLFHSICYSDDSHDAMVRDSYNKLGTAASMGCVRMETIDAKWIYENCPGGTPVTVYDDPESPGPLGKPEPTLAYMSEEVYNGWDPTDPAEGNPWHDQDVSELSLDSDTLSLTAGEMAALTATSAPEANPILFWKSSNESVAKVDSKGNVTSLGAGCAMVEVSTFNGMTASCWVEVTGELLPYDDVVPGQWYYPELRKAVENSLFSGVSDTKFAPKGEMTRAMAVQVLYNLKGKPVSSAELSFEDVTADDWYYSAVAWAVSEGIVTGVSETEFAPERAMSRQELATVLWRFNQSPAASGDLSVFTDAGKIAAFAENALAWMVERGLMNGSNGALRPTAAITRAEAAAIFCRMLNL